LRLGADHIQKARLVLVAYGGRIVYRGQFLQLRSFREKAQGILKIFFPVANVGTEAQIDRCSVHVYVYLK